MTDPRSDERSAPPSETPTITSTPGTGRTDPGRIGPYRLLQQVGEGGMGEVWEAEQTEPLRRQVALKILKQGMDSREILARFEQERQALAVMNHPFVAKVFDAGTTPEGRPYFVMEYVRGLPINEHCDRNRLTAGERLALFRQVCEGVQHAHQKAIIHRDLKPSNVLVTIQEDRAVPKIIDFGVAKATARRLTGESLHTEMGLLLGTPEYMSPEQADVTAQDVDTRADVYSLGVILYELLVGARPFESSDLRREGLGSIRRTILEVEPARPSERLLALGDERTTESARRRRTDVPGLRRLLRGDLDWITMKALEKDRTRRYGSPADLAADLGRHLLHEPILARPPSAAYRARKFVRRHRLGVLTATLGLLIPIAFAVAMTLQARRTAREAESKARVAEFLQSLFEVSDPSEARGNSITARELLDRSAERIRGSLTDEPRVRADLMTVMGTVYMNLGLYAQAAPLLRDGLETRRLLLGREHPETLDAAQAMARLDDLAGRSQEAEALSREVFETRTRVLGPDHPDTLTSQNNLANSYARQGRYQEAEPLYRRGLEARRGLFGSDHPDTLKSMNNLANACARLGKQAEAESLGREVLAIRRRLLGADHPDTIKAMVNLGNTCSRQGRLPDAEALYREALDTSRRVLGPDHPETLRTMMLLANACLGQERSAEAEGLYRQAHEVSRRVLGPDHPDTLRALLSLANAWSAEGRYAEAEAIYVDGLATSRRVLGPKHPDTLQTIYNLGCSALRRGDRTAALRNLREAVESGFGTARLLEDDPDLKPLDDDPEFEAIVALAAKNQR